MQCCGYHMSAAGSLVQCAATSSDDDRVSFSTVWLSMTVVSLLYRVGQAPKVPFVRPGGRTLKVVRLMQSG